MLAAPLRTFCVLCALCSTLASPMRGFMPLQQSHPSLMCIGAGKAGTSDLYEAILLRYPTLFNHPLTKEPLGLLREDLKSNTTAYDEYMQTLNISGPNPYTMDFNPQHFRAASAANMARKVLRDGSHVLLLLRNPVDLLVSSINWHLHQLMERLGHDLYDSFDPNLVLMLELELIMQEDVYTQLVQAVQQGDGPGAFQGWLQLADVVGHVVTRVLGERHARPTAHLMYGVYLPSLKMWADTFMRPNRTLVIMSDAYFKDPDKVFKEAITPFFYGDQPPTRTRALLSHDQPPTRSRALLSEDTRRGGTGGPIVNPTQHKKRISRGLYCALHTFFHPFNCMLSSWLASHAEQVRVYPPERVGTVGCDLWGIDSRVATSCGLGNYSGIVQTLLHKTVETFDVGSGNL